MKKINDDPNLLNSIDINISDNKNINGYDFFNALDYDESEASNPIDWKFSLYTKKKNNIIKILIIIIIFILIGFGITLILLVKNLRNNNDNNNKDINNNENNKTGFPNYCECNNDDKCIDCKDLINYVFLKIIVISKIALLLQSIIRVSQIIILNL